MPSVTDDRIEVLLDASVLINFLKNGRCDLLGAHPRYAFAVPAEIWEEIRADYPEQLQRLSAAIAAGHIRNTTVESLPEVELAAKLRADRIGLGECAAIAAAICRHAPVALQDRKAQKKARRHADNLEVVTTERIIVDLIVAGVIDVSSADRLKAEWATMKFKLPKLRSFADLLPKAR